LREVSEPGKIQDAGTRRGLFLQLAILVVLIVLVLLGSHFFPVVDLLSRCSSA